MADNVERISAERARKDLGPGRDALLVCGYDDPSKFEQNHLSGAMSLSEFESRAGSLAPDHEVIFYCA